MVLCVCYYYLGKQFLFIVYLCFCFNFYSHTVSPDIVSPLSIPSSFSPPPLCFISISHWESTGFSNVTNKHDKIKYDKIKQKPSH